jgi:hypothetical protein
MTLTRSRETVNQRPYDKCRRSDKRRIGRKGHTCRRTSLQVAAKVDNMA